MSMIPTYHRGKRDFGTGYEMMEAIEALETQLREAEERAERYRVHLDEIAHHITMSMVVNKDDLIRRLKEHASAALSDGGENE